MSSPASRQSLLLLCLVFAFCSLRSQDARILYDIQPGEVGAFDTGGDLIGAVNGVAYLYVIQDSSVVLWMSDGTTEGTSAFDTISGVNEVRGVYPGPEMWIFYINGTDNMNALWAFRPGMNLLEQVLEQSGGFTDVAVLGDEILYHANKRLYTVNLDTKEQSERYVYGFFGPRILAVNNDFAMVIADPNDTDTTATGALLIYREGVMQLIRILNTESEFSRSINPVPFGDKIYFWYDPNNDPYNLWETDGTMAGTNVIFNETNHESYLTDIYEAGGIGATHDFIFFTGLPPGGCTNCFDLYVLDPSTNVVERLDLRQGETEQGSAFTDFNGQVYLVSDTDFGRFLARTDGTHDGSEILYNRDSLGFSPSNLAVHKNWLFYVAQSSETGYELRYFVPGANEVQRIYDINKGPASSNPRRLVDLGERLVFIANDGVHGRELCVFDELLSSVLNSPVVPRALKVYPSITTQSISIEMPAGADEATFRVLTADGNVIRTQKTRDHEGIIQLPVAELSSGIYYVELRFGSGELFLGKFVRS